MPRPTLLAALAILATLPLAAAAQAHGTTVTVSHNKLEPAEVRVPAGGTVHFENVVAMPGGHTLVADDGSFKSPPLNKGEGWHHTFEKPGTVGYHIKEHPDAKGRIVVGDTAAGDGE